jgi:tRNA-splicing ligase RtcB (3'-phosphate/5'-hydroxy nucleic acid ligase)
MAYKTIMPEGSKFPIKAWTEGVLFEEEAQKQLSRVAMMPFIHKHVAVMPDVHLGIGCSVGSVIATKGAIIPATVGVDLGCGIVAALTTLKANDLPDNLAPIRLKIEEYIPVGRTDNGGNNDRGAWGNPPEEVKIAWSNIEERYRKIIEKHPKVSHRRPLNQLGSLGSGNHYTEVCLDENSRVWLMLHSGSRGPGNVIGSYFIDLARKDMEKYFINLPDRDLAYLPEHTDHFSDYIEAVHWAQDYARVNRELMLHMTIKAMKATKLLPKFDLSDVIVNCHHNYVAKENHFGDNVWITRKGAVRARKGDFGIIPGSMGAKSFIVAGKGNEDSFTSCAHGAGRKMSRTKAKETFTLKDHRAATEGVECRQDKDVIDETPGAYKDIDAVMRAQEDLVDIVHTLKQVICVKG